MPPTIGRRPGAAAARAGKVRSLAPAVGASVLTGAASGVGGVLLLLLLHLVQHAAFGYTEESFLAGVEHASAERRIVALAVGGAVVGVGWWLHRRVVATTVSVTRALQDDGARMAIGPVSADGVLQIIAVGTGASLGREGAPRELGAAFGDRIARWCRVADADHKVVLAAGAGAGLAAVYNVPIAGALFALEALLHTARPRALLLAAVSSFSAVLVARVFLGDQPSYQLPPIAVAPGTVVTCLLVGPASALLALVFRDAMRHARTHAPRRWGVVAAVPAAFVAIGVGAIGYPEILGNGKALAQVVFASPAALGVAAALVVAKPVATWLCLRAGAIGGLLTPAFATGAALGALIAAACGGAAPGVPAAEFAVLGATAFLAVAQRIPVTAGVLALELTRAGLPLAFPVLLAVLLAEWTARSASRLWERRRR